MKIGSFDLDKQVLVVAEIGNNHEGNFKTAQELVRQAARAGVGAVKFQTFKAENFVSPQEEARVRQLKGFELKPEEFSQLAQLAHSLGLQFISTPLDLPSARFLEGIVDAFKIASGDNNFYALIEQVAQTSKPLIVSLGLSEFTEVEKTVNFIRSLNGNLAVLHCVTSYPVAPEEAHLRAITFLAERLKNVTVGYSDHTLGLEASVLAVGLGARIIEKHFTLDKNQSNFRDHQLSLEPAEMAELVKRIRLAETLLGRKEKLVQASEKPFQQVARRSIAAGVPLPKGHRIQSSDLTWLRPGVGLAPGEEKKLVGRVLRRNVSFGELLREADVE